VDGGRGDYPRARRLLITADAGGSNGYRTRALKAELAALAAAETGLEITCCHPDTASNPARLPGRSLQSGDRRRNHRRFSAPARPLA